MIGLENHVTPVHVSDWRTAESANSVRTCLQDRVTFAPDLRVSDPIFR